MADKTEHQVVFVKVDSAMIPMKVGVVAPLKLGTGVAQSLEGWKVISHTVTQQLDGGMILSLFCERPAPAE